MLLQSIENDPENQYLKKCLAQSFMTKGRVDDAITIWWDLVERNPLDLGILYELYTARYFKHEPQPKKLSFSFNLYFIVLCGLSVLNKKCSDWGIGDVDWWPLVSEDDLMILTPYMHKVKWHDVSSSYSLPR